MRINDIVAMAFGGLLGSLGDTVARLRRDAIAYAVCAACAVVAVVMGISASILALEPEVGPVYARLIVAGVFMLIAIVTILAVRRANPRPKPAARAMPLGVHAEGRPHFSQIAMIVEAVMLGFAMSRRSESRRSDRR